jgi:hypothetical protein
LRQQRLLPNEKALVTISRYESHLSRQMLLALHELQRLQAVRGGQAVPAPAALDLLIDGEGTGDDLPALLTAEGAQGRPAGGSNGFVRRK